MTPKQYLQQAYLLDEKINSRLRELQQLRATAENVQGVDYTKTRVQGSRNGNTIENIACRIVGLEAVINDEIEQLLKLKEKIRTVINSVENETEQLLLRMRYVECCKWDEIADRLNYSKQRVHQLHGIALKRINPPA